MPALRKSGRRRNGRYLSARREERSSPRRIPEGGRHPGFQERVALRGAMRERGPWSGHEDGGSIQPAVRRVDDPRGARASSREEGNPRPRRSAAAGGVKGVLRSGAARPAQSSAVVQRPSPQRVVGSKRRPQAAFRSEDGFRALALRRACSAARPVSEGLPRFAALVTLLREGKVACPKHARENGSTFGVTAKCRARETRKPDARECVRASEVCCRSRWAAAGSREASVGAPREQRGARRWAGTGI